MDGRDGMAGESHDDYRPEVSAGPAAREVIESIDSLGAIAVL